MIYLSSTLRQCSFVCTLALALCGIASAQTVIPINKSVSKDAPTQIIKIDIPSGTSWVDDSLPSASLSFFYTAFSPSTLPVYVSSSAPFHSIGRTVGVGLELFNRGELIAPIDPIRYDGQFFKDSLTDDYEGFMGFFFTIEAPAPVTYYGYVEVSIIAQTRFTIHSVAYQEGGIVAGAIPEPSTYAAAAGLLAGSAALLRRRQQRKAALAVAA